MSTRPFLLSEQLDADELATLRELEPDLTDLAEASDAVAAYLVELVSTHCEGERPAVLLSGGVDSQLVAAALVRAGRTPVCITVSAASGSPDVVPAQQLAAALSLDWHLAGFDDEWVAGSAGSLVREFGTSGLYEISAALCMERACELAVELDVDELWTGAGADVLFGAIPPIAGQASHERYWRETFEMWERYLLPVDTADVYGQLAARHGQRVMMAFETAAARSLARRFDGDLLMGDPLGKRPLREAAVSLGVPAGLANRPRQAFQESTGMNATLYYLAAEDANVICTGDPDAPSVAGEPPEWIAARYWLAAQRER